MPKSLFVTSLVLLTLACTASVVNTKAPENSPYAPINDAGIAGEVSYLNAGAKAVRDARREDAYKKMHATCQGPYEIVKEEDQQGPIGTQRRIWFRCVTPPTTPG